MFWLQRRPCATVGFSAPAAGEVLQFPLANHGRLALLDGHFHAGANAKNFDGADISGLIRFAPESLAAPLSLALSLADRKLRGLLDVPSLRVAVVVFSSLDSPDSLLAPHHRDLLWNAFGLPVFEQLVGDDGRVAARECEVHDGLHCGEEAVLGDIARRFSALVVRDACECGAETPRLVKLAARQARAAAA